MGRGRRRVQREKKGGGDLRRGFRACQRSRGVRTARRRSFRA